MTPAQAYTYPIDLKHNHGYVYCLTFPSGKRYIGQCIRAWRQRWRLHKAKCSCCKAVHSAISRYPIEQIKWQILGYASSQTTLNLLQSHFIECLNTLAPNGYNLRLNDIKGEVAKDTCFRISLSNTYTALRKTKPQATWQDGWNLWLKQHCDDPEFNQSQYSFINIASYKYKTWNKRIDTHKYIRRTFTPFQILSRRSKEVLVRPQVKAKISGANHYLAKAIYCVQLKQTYPSGPDAEKLHPDWSRHNIAKVCTGQLQSYKGLHFYYKDAKPQEIQKLKQYWKCQPRKTAVFALKNFKPVLCLQTGLVYPSAKTAAKMIKIHHIRQACTGERKSAGGYTWRYLTDTEIHNLLN